MYTLNIARAIKRCLSMKSEIISLKTIIRRIGFCKQAVIIQWKAWKKKKNLLLLKNKQIQKIHNPRNAKEN